MRSHLENIYERLQVSRATAAVTPRPGRPGGIAVRPGSAERGAPCKNRRSGLRQGLAY